MNEEINKIIDNLEGCIGMFDYLITPIESNLLVSYIRELQQQNQKYKEVIDKAIEYIENNDIIDARLHNPHKNYGSVNELYQILKGDRNE